MTDWRDEEVVLYVDDEEANLQLFRRAFGEEHAVLTAASGAEALRLLERGPVSVVLADQRMPGMSGIRLLETVARSHPETIRVLVTAYSDVDVVIAAINRGSVYRYLRKPWDVEEMAATLREALEIHALKRSNQTLLASLDGQNRLLKRKVQELRFLSELDLRLRETREPESVLEDALATLGEELQALEGWCAEQGGALPCRRWTPAGGCRTEPVEELAPPFWPQLAARLGSELRSPLLEALSPQDSLCILPLSFRERRFGCLVYRFNAPPPFEPEDLLFAQAASRVVSSTLFGLHARREELQGERFALLGQMASMVAHDLKGPLATILGFVRLLRDNLDATQRGEFTAIIDGEIRRLIEMVEELLSFSRGETHLNRQGFDLFGLLKEVLELFEVGFRSENIHTELRGAGCGSLWGDRRKLQKVLVNLLQNAREHLVSATGDRVIRIEVSESDGEAVLVVSNSGPPVPQALLPHLFDPFVSHSKGSGTGLGLTICRKIVEEHGGVIEARSSAEGTSFRIVLPSGPPPGPGTPGRSPAP